MVVLAVRHIGFLPEAVLVYMHLLGFSFCIFLPILLQTIRPTGILSFADLGHEYGRCPDEQANI